MLITFDSIPSEPPSTPLLDIVTTPEQLRELSIDQLDDVSNELREYLLYTVGKTGGHLGAGLGVIELTTVLHHVYNTPDDRIVWDVGHQSYPHKILTGRREKFANLRQRDGIAGFPKRSESEHDQFGVGHSSTSISAALGMAIASKQQNKTQTGQKRKHVAVIGDGAMSAGMAFEAMNHAASSGEDILVILNDNQMSISENVGALSSYLSRIWASRFYNRMREGGKKVLEAMPPASEFVRRTEEHMKGFVSPGTLFEEMGFNYIGPIDGHNIKRLHETISNLKELNEPILLHCVTEKGRGFSPAEKDPIGYHALGKIESKPKTVETKKIPKYQDVFGQWLCDMATSDEKLIGITPAMCEGSGMVNFSKQFPQRYIDVAIAEQHAVTLAAGIACEGEKPVVAIYSTFLQRAYDQLIHDVAIQNCDVLFALDRAGVVGEDGPTHAGSFDNSFLRCVPNMLVMTPSDEQETRLLLSTGYHYQGPASVRYPRGAALGIELSNTLDAIAIGEAKVVRHSSHQQSNKVVILCFGTLLKDAKLAADMLDATLVDMRFVKPLDTQLINQVANECDVIVTIEENVISGGAGSAVTEYLLSQQLMIPTLQLGLPDQFQDHGTRQELLDEAGLGEQSILQSIQQFVNQVFQ